MITLNASERHDEYAKGEPRNVWHFTSPSKRYTLAVHGYASKTGCWDVCRGVLRDGEDVVMIINFNYSRPTACFWEVDGVEYLFCTPKYTEMTVVRCDTRDVRVHAKDQWCAISVCPSADGKTLAVSGCYWAGPSDLRFYDVSAPMAAELTLIYEVEDPRNSEREHWIGNDFYCDFEMWKGRDGLTDDDAPWKSCEAYTDDNGNVQVRDLPNTSFNADGSCTTEYLANFMARMVINPFEQLETVLL